MPTIYEVQAPDGRILEIEGPDDASQDQIMLAAQEIYSGLPERSVEAKALQQPEEKPFGVAEYAQAPLEFGKAVTRGFGSALLSSAAGLAELADIATDRLGFEDLIDSGQDNELIRLANAGQEALQETLGASEPYRDLWFTKFGEGVGSIGSFFLPTGLIGAAGRAAGLADKTTRGLQAAGAGATGVGMGADEQAARIEWARRSGIEISEDQEDASIFLGGLVGLTEIATPLLILKKIRGVKDPKRRDESFDAIRSAIKTGTLEGVQEVTASLMQDAIQYGIYDENVPFGDSLWDDFTIGAASGALVDAITTGMFNRRSRLSREIELDREKLIREEEERQREDYYNKVALAEESLKERDVQSQLAAIAAQEDAELAAADVLNYQVDQSEQEALLGLIAPYQPSQEALRQPKGDIEGRDIESTVTKQGREYARQIARNASKKAGLFPSTGRFEIREEQGGPSGTNYVVYNTADGRQYGQPTKDLEFAKHFSLGLNNEMINKSVNESIIDAMDMSPESYDPKTAESIFMIGQRLNRPKSYTISEATLNEAAGTVASKDKPFLENLTLDQIHQIQYGVPPFQDGKKKLYKDLKNLTASQQINFERAKKGLPPLREFTLQEAKDALGNKYDKVFDVLLDVQQPDLAAIRQEFGEAGVNVQGGRQRYQDEINTLKEVKDTLASKNIVSDIGSKELSYVFKKITGESSINKMTPSQRMFLVGELKRLPALDKPSKLPDLSPKPYTRADFNNAMNYVISTGDGTVDNIKAVLPEDLSEKRKSVAAGQIRAELLSRGVINQDNTVSELTALPAPEPRKPTEVTEKDFTVEQSVEALDFQKKLSEKLKGMGLDDIRVRILDQMKTAPDITREGRVVSLRDRGDFSAAEGLFDTGSRTIFLGLDSARASARDQSPEAIDFALSEVMDHEIVHALRNLDLWTQKEFSLLENAARKLKMPGTNKTFYQDAVERYVTQQKGPQKRSPVQAMEEAIAEMVRYSKKDRKIIGGKPRNLIDRVFEFFRRLGSAMQGTGFNSMNDLINDIESGALGARERGVVRTARGMEAARRAVPERGIGLARDVKEFRVVEEDEQPVESGVQMSINRIIGRNGTELNQAPDGKFAHGLPSELLVDGPKQKARSIVVQNFTPQNTDQVLSNIQTVKSNNPDALRSTENWIAMQDDAFGGDFVPIPPLKAIQYAQSPELLAEKLKQLTPELKAGVDEGFKYVQQIKNLYNTQSTSPDLTGRLFMWGLLSRGAGPVQQEFAFLNLLESATPYIKKASEGKMTQADVINWKRLVGKSIPSGSPAKSVTMNANDIGKLLFELGKVPEGSSQTVMQTLHNMLADPNVSGKEFRNEFFRLTNKPGVDNKVVSFIALVAGKDDVLVMDRIQGRHLWNDGRFGDKNIYDGLKKGKVKGGLNAIFAGPRGLLVTESLEDGLSSVVQQAYDMIGRPQDASVGRMHWETWVIDGNQAVSHSTLEAVRTGREIGGSVTEGKRGTFSSGTTYRQTANGPITEYPLSDGTVARMTLDQQKEFEAFIKNPKNGIIPKGFLVGRSKDRPWFELPEVNREKLDETARRFENANPDGSIRSGNARSIRAGASDAGRRRAAAGPVGSVEAPATDEISSSLKRVDGIIERNPAESITRIYDESVTRPFLEEQEINGYPPFSWQAKTYSVGDKIVYQMADKLIGLKKAEEGINRYRALAGIPPIKNKDSAYVGEESIPGKIGIEVKDFQENVQRPYAKKIVDSGIPIEELDEFLTFRHAVERNNRIQLRDPSRNVETNPGSGSLKTGERLSNFYVKQIMENRYGYEWDDASGSWVGGNDRGKKLMDLAADADSIVNSTIDRMIQGGLLSKDNAEALRGLYKYYAPLKGKAQEDDFADFVAVGSGLNTKGKEFQRAFGRESASESPLGHIMLNVERTIARSVKNENFGQKLVNLIKDNPNSEFWNVYDATDPRFKQAADTYYTYVGSDAGMQGQRFKEIPRDMNSRDFVKYTVIKQDGLAKFDGDLIGAKIDGNEYFIEIKDDRLRRAIQSVNAGEADNLIRKFSMVNRWLSMMNTSLNPEFVIGNFSRDLQTAIYNIIGEQTMEGGKIKDVKRITRRVLKDVIPSMGVVYKGMRRYNMKDGTLRGDITGISETDYLDFREFMESGAKADWFYTRPAEEQVQTIQSMVDMANGTFTGNFRKGYEGVMNFVEDANGSVENAVRFATFKAARDELLNSGVDRAEAVATASTLAKNLTVNFNRKGMQGDLLNALYLFYNASVQGTMNFARGLNVFDPGSSRTKQAIVASMIGFGALMAARGEEESEENSDSGRSYYSEIPDYIKQRNIVIMKDNGKDYYTIPLPYGYNVFHVAGVKLFEMKNDTISVEKASGDLLSTFLGSFSPIGFFPLPTITQPFWELAKNENYFGSPIYKENFPTGVQSPASQLAMSSTRTPFKNAAKILNSLTGGNEYESGYMDVSPDALEHIAEFALGGAGTFGLRSMNAFEKWLAGEELESREVPFLRRVMGEPDKNIAVADYYDRKVKLEQKEAAIQGLRGADRIKYRERNQDYVTMFGVLNSIERKLRKVRQMESQLRSRAALSPANAEQYATGLEVLEERKQKLYDQFNNLYDKRVGRTK
jgi:hypothetical protein